MTGPRRSIDALFGCHDGTRRRGAFFSGAPGSFSPEKDDDVGGRGLLDCFHAAGNDGLELCTESLGSESCDGRMDPEEEETLLAGTAWAAAASERRDDRNDDDDDCGRRLEAALMRRERKKTEFPPPLRWMAGVDGRLAGIIRAERRGGRLVLTEVRIERREVFRATREDGRLRLHSLESEEYEVEKEEEEEEELSPAAAATMEENVERRESQRGVGEGFRRCQDPVSSNHEVPAWWHHRFVTMA